MNDSQSIARPEFFTMAKGQIAGENNLSPRPGLTPEMTALLPGALTAFSELTDDPDRATAYLNLRHHLFPTGIGITKRTYLDEAGATGATATTAPA